MDLWQEIMCRLLQYQDIKITFPQAPDISKLFEMECYKALKKISEIIKNKELDDKECFMQIEEIVCLFEKLGSSGGNRHDF